MQKKGYQLFTRMKSTTEIINILKRFKEESAAKYGIKSLGVFGSVARNQQDEASDLDVFVTLQDADFFTLEKIKEELEKLTSFNIDIIHLRDSLWSSFKQSILKDAIYI